MRKLALGTLAAAAPLEQKLDWIIRALRTIETASNEDALDLARDYGASGSFTETRQVNVTSPSAANLAAVLATLLADLRRGGTKRT